MDTSQFTVYIIKSDKGYTYIGQTKDLTDRMGRHNNNRSKSTKNKGPWKWVISFVCDTRSEAMKLEKKLKGFKNSEKAINYMKKLK